MEQGTGKTAIAIKAIEERYLAGEISKVMIFVPSSIIYNWTLEFDKFLTKIQDPIIVETLPQKKKAKREEAFQKFLEYDLSNLSLTQLREQGYRGKKKDIVKEQQPKLMILLVNYEKAHIMENLFKKFKADMIILDESHNIKNRGAKTSKAIYRLSRSIPYRILMTGTPIMNGIEDVFMQFKVMDENIYGPSYSSFEKRYLVKGGYMGKVVVGYQNEEEFKRILTNSSYRVQIQDVVELPPLSMKYYTTDLQPKTQKIYNEMEKEMVTYVEDTMEEVSRSELKEVCRTNLIEYDSREPYYTLLLKAKPFIEVSSADLVITQMIRLQQITGGFLTRDDQETIQLGDEKAKLAIGIVEESTRPVLIFCRYIAEIEYLEKTLKKATKKNVGVYRDVNTRKQVYDDFQAGKIDVLILQFQSGSVGLNLQRSNRLIFYSWSFSSGDYLQAIARIKRNGQKHPMEVIHLIANETIDEKILNALREKEKIAKKFLN